jgi:hypothetical protein
VDLSGLIFIGVAVAWAMYLVPMAVKHHAEVGRSRSVERFSDKVRVLARREAVDRSSARLVTPGQPVVAAPAAAPVAAPATPVPAPVELTPVQLRARRAAAKRATKRRRNVLAVVLVLNIVVITVAAFSVIAWPYVAIPAGLLAAWLVACRLMVKSERRLPVAASARVPAESPAEYDQAGAPAGEDTGHVSDEIDPMVDTSAGIAAIVDPAMWDPVPVTLPTYVTKPAATRRTVRTIDLDSTGVWTSGRTDADAALARESDEADKAARKSRRDGDDQRAVGS